MILAIPYRDDGNDGYELRYAIRSMKKYFTQLSGVLLIGDRPTWYIGKHFYEPDHRSRKAYSIYRKILAVPYDTFLFSNDDIFATQPFDPPPLYYTGPLKTAIAHGIHKNRFILTSQLLPDGLSYDLHVPMVIDRDKFETACNVDWSKEYLYRSIYGNYIGGGVQMNDPKIRNGVLQPGPFFSTDERSAKIINLEDMFPERSIYEA
jgi:hypothetical protein